MLFLKTLMSKDKNKRTDVKTTSVHSKKIT